MTAPYTPSPNKTNSSAVAHSSCALVIGGSGVIGRAICRHFAKNQWRVGIHYHHNKSEAEQTAQAIHEKGGIVSLFEADIREFPQVNHMIRSFASECGHLDVLVYAAGCATNSLIVRTSPESWTNLLATNLSGTFYALKVAGAIFQEQKDGAAIIIGSLSSLLGARGQGAYTASKAGLLGLMKTTAREWGPYNIRINTVFPGWHRSPLSGSAFPDTTAHEDHVLKRTPKVEDVAQVVYQLAQMKDVSGQVWNLDNRIS